MAQINDSNIKNEFNDESREHLKLVEINTVEIGLSKDENWIFRKGKAVYESKNDSEAEIIFLLPVLETSYEDFKFTIIESLISLDKQNLYESFPVKLILDTALKSHSKYWIDLALNWLEKINNIKSYSQQILSIVDDKKYSQKTRHRALKLIPKTR